MSIHDCVSPPLSGFYMTDPRPPEYIQVSQRKTVKELLLLRRQEWNAGNSVHPFKRATFEACGEEPVGPPPAPVNSHVAARLPGHANAQRRRVAPTAEPAPTLFHWQIQRELRRLDGVAPETLYMQDADGDTCVPAAAKVRREPRSSAGNRFDRLPPLARFLHVAVAQERRALAYALATKMSPWGSLDTKEHNGQTALQVAAAADQQLIVHDLLTLGAQVNTRDRWGRSPLHVCAEKGHWLSLQSIWRTLTGSGQPIDFEMFNYDGESISSGEAERDASCEPTFSALSGGLTPLHAAVLTHNAALRGRRRSRCAFEAEEQLQKALRAEECVKTLLLMGASCGTKDQKSGRTCLHVASEEANVELMKVLLARPSSSSVVNVQTFSGNTALHVVSALQNHDAQVEAARLLMRRGADPEARNLENEPPAQLAPEGPIGEQVGYSYAMILVAYYA
ncbi:NF-kappa-B inhibitor zeta [Liparis tanakae]|uniref:NF-kappa-B inhibitor zeta n=1 Tax=Liparis tanakae TaxID=230148 RepID=A0A4Z2GRD8_9TELE|nr:NF-kappa-B inhibitor zeta [Liparis tanakae]